MDTIKSLIFNKNIELIVCLIQVDEDENYYVLT